MKTGIVLKLRDSELRYRRLFETAQDGILILDAETGMIEDVNPYLIKMLGYSREEFVEKKLWEVGAFRDIEASKDAFEALQDREYIRYEDLPLKTKDGRLIQVEFVSNVYLAGGEKIIQCDIRDITEHRRILAALQENERKYHDLINQSPDGYFIIDLSGNILTVNNAMCKELEFSEEELLSLNIWDIIPGQYLDEYRKKLTRVLQGESLKEATEYIVHGKDGKNHYVEVLSAPRYSGRDIVGFQGIARDITGRKQAEEALQESETRSRQLVEHLPTVVYVNAVGDASSTLYVSPQIEALVGYTPQEWMADPKLWSKTLHSEDSQQVLAQAALTDQTNKPFEMEYRMIARDGRLVWVHDEVILVKDSKGQPQFWQGIMLDITERKVAEESLRKSESLLRATGKIARVGGWEFDVATKKLVWTEEVNEIHEVGRDYEPTINKWFNFFASEATPGIAHAMQRAAAHAEPFDLELPIITEHGNRRWVHTLGQAQQSNGKTTKVSGTLQDITERKLAKEALRESESSLQGILRSTADGILAVSKENKTLFANERFMEMWHIPQAILATKDDSLLLQYVLDQLSDPQAFLKTVQELYRSKEESFDTLNFKDGRVFERISHPLISELGSHPLLQKTELRGRVWSFRDVTYRKRAEEQARFQATLLNAVGQAIIATDAAGTVTYVNRETENLYGWRAEEAEGRNILDITVPQISQAQAREIMAQLSQGGSWSGEFLVQHRDGRVFPVLVHNSPVFNHNGELVGIIGISSDITKRKQAEEALRASEEKYRMIVETSAEGMWVVDKAWKTTYINPAMAEMLGYTADEILGRSPMEFVDQEDAPRIFGMMKRRENGITEKTEVGMRRKDGSMLWAYGTSVSIVDDKGEFAGGLSLVVDITQRKQAEEKIQQQLQHLTALSTIDRVIAANFDLKLSLSEILAHVTKELNVDAAAILMLNSNSQILEYGAERGFRTKAVRKVPVRLGGSYAGRVVLNRKFVQVQNLRDEPDNLFLGTSLAGEGFVFYYGLPLITKGQVKGVLEVFQRAALEPDTDWLDFLHSLASQAAIAIENAMLFESLQRSNLELTLAYDATIQGWSRALDLRDKETEGHTQRVTEMTEKLARSFGVREAELMQIRWGALLHDIGKMGVPDGILLKPGPLTDEEWVAMKKHPDFAYEMLSPIRYLQQSLDIPYCHHEKWDGTGYPRGLKGTQIPLSARIFAVVDVWDALCSDRPYRAGWPEEKVREHIRALSGTHFDPQVVDIFMQSLD